MGDRVTIKEVFNQCQTGMQGHGKLMKTLHKIYDKTEFPSFWAEFSHYMRYAMIIFKREPAVERVIDFISNFVTSLCKKSLEKADDTAEDDTEEEEDSVADNKLLQEMFDFLLNSHNAKDRGVRFRCCQLVNKLLTNLGEDAQIDDDLYDRLYECMLERLKDKCPVVRYHAVMAMTRLQDPSDENCPVIKAFLFLLNCDPNPDVRRAVLSAIAPSSKTLASIIDRTRDVKDTVRKTAYEVLAEKIHIKAMSIALRLQLVNEGLKDRAEAVKQACSGKLLQSWMRTLNGNILELLKSLDVEDSTDVCSRVLETLFKASTVSDVIERFDILNENLLVPEEVLTSESALYWQVVCKYIHAMGTDSDEYMEKVLPTVVDFCAFMQRYIDALKTTEDPEIQLGREFVIEQLLLITSYMDTADAASKKALETLLHNMLMADYVSHRLVKSVIARICFVRGTGDNLVPYFAETVSEIREPITVIEKDVAAEQKRQINLKIASIRVQLNQFREDLETAVKEQNFEKAGEIKNTIAQLDAEKNQLLETSEPVREEIRTEKNDPLTLLKCQTIISEMLQILKVNTVSPTLQMMIESQIVPGIQNEDADVRNMAMQALGLCCYQSKDLLVTYIPLFMQASQIDVEEVRVTALRVLFDLLLVYGLEIVDASESSSTDSSDDQQDGETLDSTTNDSNSRGSDTRSGVASKLVAIICSFLDGESSELRTCAAEGLCKLLLTGRVVSSKILSHLILLWYNPLSEDDTHLRDCLGTFFPLYALASRSNQEVVEEAFLPTLRTLLNAPASSPLAEVDVNNVAELLVQLTNTKLLTANRAENDATLDNPGHDHLSETVCNEILSEPESVHLKLWVRILNQMEMSPDNEVVLKDLRVLAYKMVKLVKEKMSLKGLQKFQERINKLAEKFISENDDIENMVVEPVENEVAEEESLQDSTLQTPKRKRIRGLYSQNMTLAMDSETELDIAGDPMVEVDASCLMGRSSVDTPSRRARKNTTTTEIAEEDTGNVTQTNTTSSEQQLSSTNIDDEKNETQSTEDEGVENDTSAELKTSEDVESESNKKSKSPERHGRTADKKSSSPKKGDKKSPVKNQEKRKASKSPAHSPLKRMASESPAKKSQEKRKASKSPSRDRKRMSKSPSRSASNARKGSKSPDKKTTKSPVQERSTAKSPAHSGDRKSSASPVKRRSMSNSPDKSPQKKKSVNGIDTAGDKKKSPKSPAKPSKESSTKSVPGKSVGSTVRNSKPANIRNGSQLPVRKPSESKTGGVVELSKPNLPSKKLQSTLGKNAAAVRKDIRTAPAKVPEKNAQRVSSRTVKSPLQGKDRTGKTAVSVKSKTSEIVGASKAPVRSSPRVGRSGADQTVADTPESIVRRSSARSVASSPSVGTPRSQGTDISIPETPEDVMTNRNGKKTDTVKSGLKATTRTAGRTPEVGSSGLRSSRLRGTPSNTTPTVTRKPTKRTAASSSASASDSSPDKPATKISRSARGKVVSSASSTPGSASSSRSSKSKPATTKPSPVKNLTKELKNASDDDDEEDSLRRRAKPSRRSNTAPSTVMSPPVTGRTTRASLSQSSVESPTVGSPSQRGSTRRNRKGLTDSSQETVSLISSQKSPAVSTKSQTSNVTKKTTASRSQSTSTSIPTKATKPVDSKATRSAVATRVGRTRPGQLKSRPTRTTSRSSDRK